MGRNSTWGRFAATLGATALIALAAAGPVTADDDSKVSVDDATFVWGLNGYAQKGVFGAWTISDLDGDVEELDGDEQDEYLTDPIPATSFPSDADNKRANAIKFTKGEGSIDSETGAGKVTWEGSYVVNAYPSSYNAPDETYENPELEVDDDGSGTLSMEFSLGAGLDINGNPTEGKDFGRVTLMKFDANGLSAKSADGYRVTPRYQGVENGQSDQTKNCSSSGGATGWWGSWPKDFIDKLDSTAIKAHFYSTGCGGMQDTKPPLPFDVTGFPAPNAEPNPEPTPTASPSPSATPSPTPTPTPTPTATTGTGGKRSFTGAELRWGMTNEANNAAHAPGTWNIFSAGKLPNPGKGGVAIDSDDWKQASGNVSIEKWDGSAYKKATWSGLSTDADGNSIAPASSKVYSNHQWVFGKGTGTADSDSGTAHITWDGDVSVAFYSGYTFFYLSDPILDVSGGKGVLKATLSGYGGSRDDASAWEPVKARTVTLATLSKVSLGAKGFTVTPAFDNVNVGTKSCKTDGSFPKSFIEAQEDLGTAAFWCTSGSGTDDAKKALPITVSFDASDPVATDEPDESDSDSDDVSNDASLAPNLASALASVPAAVAGVGSAVANAASFPVRLVSSQLGAGAPTLWIVGSALWVLTAAAVAGTLHRFPTPTYRSPHDDLS